jgi:N-acetylglucosamine kinase-like BadF-type ATPase
LPVLVAGIDAGGTSLRIRFADQAGKVVKDLQGAASSDLGPESLRKLLPPEEIKQNEVGSVFAGIAGVSRAHMKERWASELKALFPNALLELVPDYVPAFYGAVDEFGILVIAGTGSVVYGEYKGKCRVGGRGWEWGDWGSGAWITSEMLRLTLNSLDGLFEPTPLAKAICAELGTDEPIEFCDKARQLCQSNGRGFLVPVALSCAQAGDRDALSLFSDAAGWLALQVEAAANRLALGVEQKFPVATVGGLWDCGPCILEPFSQSLKTKFPNACVTPAKAAPIEGAIRQALALLKQRVS